MTKKQNNVKAGRNESRSDQESVDYHEYEILCQNYVKKWWKRVKKLMTMEIPCKFSWWIAWNFYRSKQNNEMANFDNSFCTPHNYNVRKQSVQKDLPKKWV